MLSSRAQWNQELSRLPWPPVRTPPAEGGTSGSSQQGIPRDWRVWSRNIEWEVKWPVIRQSYSVKDAAATAAFVLDHIYLLDLLLEAYPRLVSLYEPGCTIRLKRAADPDVAERVYVLVTVTTSLPVSEALGQMDRFADEWWLDRIARAGRDLVFVVDFA